MSTPLTAPLLVAPPPRRLLLRLVVGLAVPVVILGIGRNIGPGLGDPVETFLVLFAVAQAAVALAICHKEILAASFTFTQPGLRSRVARTQIIWALMAGFASVVAAFLLKVVPWEVGPVAMVFASAVVVYAFFAILTFQVAWSFQFPAWMFYGFFLIPLLVRGDTSERLATMHSHPIPWLGAALLLLMALGRRSGSASLHRKLCGSMVLAPEDLLRPGRLQHYKESRSAHQRLGRDMRWRSTLLDRLLARATAATLQTRPDHARAWLLTHAGVSQIFSRRRWILPAVLLAGLAMAVCGGYYDSWVASGDLNGWFSGLVFNWATFPVLGVCMAMNNTTAILRGRAAGLRSELLALAGSAAIATVAGLSIAGVFALLAKILPDIVVFGRSYVFTLPRPHILLIPPLMAPGMWLAVAIRPRPNSAIPSMATFQIFILGHALMTYLPYRISMPIWVGLMVTAGMGAYALRRRWWRQGDHAA